MVNLVLVEPEIPANTGNIARTCAATRSRLHLVKPLGFDISDKAVKRAGLDYWPMVDITVYENIEEFLSLHGDKDLWLTTTKAPRQYTEADLSGEYRLLWDEANLYVLVVIKDDVKRQAAFMFDNGSLESVLGEELWRLEFDRTVHAGGALKNRRQEDTLRLPAGKYELRLETDECHATGHWDDLAPDEPFTGIKIYALDR